LSRAERYIEACESLDGIKCKEHRKFQIIEAKVQKFQTKARVYGHAGD